MLCCWCESFSTLDAVSKDTNRKGRAQNNEQLIKVHAETGYVIKAPGEHQEFAPKVAISGAGLVIRAGPPRASQKQKSEDGTETARVVWLNTQSLRSNRPFLL